MNSAERQHVQRLFEAWRQIIGDYKMVSVRFDRPLPGTDMDAFAAWCRKQRGAKTGTLSEAALLEIEAIRVA